MAGGDADREAIENKVERARQVRRWWSGATERPDAVIGLALSGGGIRSATFSLGLVQALARSPRGALGKVDVLSTVSGGGYVGTFLRSLFLPQRARGIGAELPFDPETGAYRLDPDEVAAQAEFAAEVLASGPDRKNIAEQRRNPIWWLREHSRYLAPNGATDYGYAVAYLSRNWIAMLYIFVLAVAGVMAVVTAAEAWAAWFRPAWLGWTWPTLRGTPAPLCPAGGCSSPDRIVPISPVFALAACPVVLDAVLAIAYWLGQAMSANEPDVARQWRNLGKGVLLAALAGGFITGWWWVLAVPLQWRPVLLPMPLVLAAGLALTAAAIVLSLPYALRNRGDTLLTSEYRRRLTKTLAFSNLLLLCVLVLAVVDSAGAGLAYWLHYQQVGIGRAVTVGLVPAAAFLLKRLPEWGGRSGAGPVMGWLSRFLPALALVAGVLLYGSVAVATDAALHCAAWDGRAWVGPARGSVIWLAGAAIWVLALVSGRSTGFINLSSLHLLYATRLTRAYIGASNMARLAKAAQPGPGGEITDNDDADYIRPRVYGLTDLPAPIHIINTTINETVDPHSQLVARDRKGGLLSVEPAGIRTDRHDERLDREEPAATPDRAMDTTELTPWDRIGHHRSAEDISLGQWCAISGAAASSGMGRLTKIGYALALTFANVRLGYWWWAPKVCVDFPPPGKFYKKLDEYFGTFVYLANELTARYSRGYQRKYLTDGGHFENSGAYPLIRRRVPLIVVSDNGADPGYAFADLQNLVRTARLDFGAEVAILQGAELAAFLGTLGCTDPTLFVDPARSPRWRDGFEAAGRPDAVLALRVGFPAEPDAASLHLLWIKPRLFDELPQDVAGYASEHPDFPQQTTANQFFDEAQWESYRKLGELTMERLLRVCPRLLA